MVVETGVTLGVPHSAHRLDVLQHLLDVSRLPVPSGATAPLGRPAPDPVEVVDSIVELLREISSERPVVLALEDLHHADVATLGVIASTVRMCEDLPVTLVATTRSGFGERIGALEEFVRRRVPEGRGVVVDLGPLTRPNVAALVAGSEVLTALADRDVDELVGEVLERTGGNPLFVSELLKHRAQASGEAAAALDGRDALAVRMLANDPEAIEVARALSVFTRIDLEDLHYVEVVTALPVTRIYAAFDRLVRTALLVQQKDAFEFAHPLFREVLYDGLGLATRRRLHAIAAAELTAAREAGRGVDVFEWATHVVRSTSRGDEDGVAAALTAAEAAAPLSPLVASGWLQQAALHLAEGDPRGADLQALAASSLSIGGDRQAAIRVATAGLEEYGFGTGSLELLRTASLVLASLGRYREALDLVDRADSVATDDGTLTGLRALAHGQLGHRDEAETAWTASLDLLAYASEPDVAHLLTAALGALVLGKSELETYGRALEGIAAHVGPALRLELLSNLLPGVLQGVGGAPEARRLVVESHRVRPGALPTFTGPRLQAEVELAHYSGDWERGAEDLELSLRGARRPDLNPMTDGARGLGALILDDLGRPREAAAMVEGLEPRTSSTSAFIDAGRARVLAGHGEVAGALALLTRRVETLLALGQSTGIGLVLEELVLLEAAAGTRGSGAGASLVHPVRELTAPLAWPVNDIYTRRALARITGDVAEAVRSLEIARSQDVAGEVARCELLLGELEVDARSHLVSAQAAFQSRGASRLLHIARAQMRARGIPVPRIRQQAPGTHAMELEVARLAVEGLTNQQIAIRLSYSIKTVEVYLSRVYRRLGVGGRVELTGAVARGEIELARQVS